MANSGMAGSNMATKQQLKFILPLVAFLLLALLLGIGLTLNPQNLPSTLINKPAPDFSLTQVAMSDASPELFANEQMLGKRWLLNVWASWCAACRLEHPLFNQLARQTAIPLVGLNYKDKQNDAKKWLQEHGNPYDYLPADISGDVGIDWGVYGVPETFVIDEQGMVIYKHTGPVTTEIIETDILPLFSSTVGIQQ